MRQLHTILTTLFVFLWLAVTAQNQTGLLKGTVISASGIPVNGATVFLLDSSNKIKKTALSDASGIYEMQNLHEGKYLLKITAVGFQDWTSVLSDINTLNNFGPVKMENLTGNLGGVSVSTKKPFLQRLNDRLIVNVENSIVSAGNTAMDIIQRSPGVTVSPSDQISLQGRAGVIIMIDGKPTAMSGEDLANYLRSIPSSLIERIEIITNPSAKYDAAGNAGIIDIRFKKDQRLGSNGVATVSGGAGRYTRTNESLSYNYRNKKLLLFSNLSYGLTNFFNNIISKKDFYDSVKYIGSYDQDNMVKRGTNSFVGRLGADYNVDAKTIIGVVFSGTKNSTNRTSYNHSSVLDQTAKPSSSFVTTAKGKELFSNYVANLNIRRQLDTAGRTLSADVDRAVYKIDWASLFHTRYYTASGQTLQPDYITQSDQDGLTKIHTAKIDYVHPLAGKAKLEVGAKAGFVAADNSVLFYDKSNSSVIIDSSKSNHFLYDENINAAYLNFSKEFNKISVQIGVRAEYTHIKTNQIFYNQKFDSNYIQAFPSAFLTYKLGKDQTIGLSLSKRIDRPTFGQLNPFKIFVDPSFIATGDPNLLPTITWSYEMNYTYKQLNLVLGYSHSKNSIDILLMPLGQTKTTLQIPVNFKSFDYFGLTASYPLRINKYWNIISNTNIFHGTYVGRAANTNVNAGQWNLILSVNNAFTLNKGWSAELNLNYNSETNQGVMRIKPSTVLSAGIQKSLMKNKANIKLGITDILWRQWPRAENIYAMYYDKWMAKRDTRITTLSFTYRFGNSKMAAARRRATASEEERRRAGGN